MSMINTLLTGDFTFFLTVTSASDPRLHLHNKGTKIKLLLWCYYWFGLGFLMLQSEFNKFTNNKFTNNLSTTTYCISLYVTATPAMLSSHIFIYVFALDSSCYIYNGPIELVASVFIDPWLCFMCFLEELLYLFLNSSGLSSDTHGKLLNIVWKE